MPLNLCDSRGDHPVVGDHKQAKGVFDFDSVHLIQCCKKLNAGTDWEGNALDGGTDFFVGAVVTPEADPLEPQLYKFATSDLYSDLRGAIGVAVQD